MTIIAGAQRASNFFGCLLYLAKGQKKEAEKVKLHAINYLHTTTAASSTPTIKAQNTLTPSAPS